MSLPVAPHNTKVERENLRCHTMRIEEVVDADAGEEQATDDEKTTPECHSEQQQQLEEEDDLCPLCLDPVPSDVEDYNFKKTCLLYCCGKTMCLSCWTNSRRQLTCCPLCRQTFPTSDDEILERLRNHAADGQAWACFQMGQRYEKGDGVPQNYKVACKFWRKAADKGHIPSCHSLGQCYWTYNGLGVKQSYALAWEFCGKALKVGYVPSQWICGQMYLHGNGVAKDVPEGVRLLRLAAEQGFGMAQLELAQCYNKGVGVEPSLETAIAWLLKAAKQKCSSVTDAPSLAGVTTSGVHFTIIAQWNLGKFLLDLYGYRAKPAALYWFRKAAPALTHFESMLIDFERKIDLHCANCGVEGVFKKRCSRCRAVSYCSVECQRKHWKKGGHKNVCCDKDMDIKDFEINRFFS